MHVRRHTEQSARLGTGRHGHRNNFCRVDWARYRADSLRGSNPQPYSFRGNRGSISQKLIRYSSEAPLERDVRLAARRSLKLVKGKTVEGVNDRREPRALRCDSSDASSFRAVSMDDVELLGREEGR